MLRTRDFIKRASAAVEMARAVGIHPTIERVRLSVRARQADRLRKRRFKRFALDGPVNRDILGNQMLLDPSIPGLDRDLLLDGIREPIATGRMMRVLQPDDVVLEVGANIGYYALLESRLCRKVYAVEPHPGNFERLKANIKLNGTDNVETFNVAFSDEDAPVDMAVSNASNWHRCGRHSAGRANIIQVPGQRIDTFVKNKEQPTFIKMDVEGYELEVLRGAVETMPHIRGIFLELHGRMLAPGAAIEILDLMATNGLEPSLVVQYDFPGIAHVYPDDHVDAIRAGDRGTFELFFERPVDAVETI